MSGRPERHSTFHDQWYLVENLTSALRPDVHIRRQAYRGTLWYFISEPDNNAHFRLAQGGYGFVSMLDGKRTVQELWEIFQDAGESEALTQGEAIALLGRLHSAGLLLLDMPADSDILLRRQQERRLKKLGSTLSSFLLFLRIPLWAPDAFFTRFQAIGSFAFRPAGFFLWLVLLCFAGRILFLSWDIFVAEARQSLNPSNLPWIYAVIILSKVVHECGHAFACKYFSARDGLPGYVHSMGIMLLLFAPVPYIDVSSSVQIRSRWARAAIGLAGVYCELFLAFLSTIIWANTAEGTSLLLASGRGLRLCHGGSADGDGRRVAGAALRLRRNRADNGAAWGDYPVAEPLCRHVRSGQGASGHLQQPGHKGQRRISHQEWLGKSDQRLPHG